MTNTLSQPAMLALRSTPLLEALSPAEFNAIAAQSAEIKAPRGTSLFQQGVAATHLFVVVDGWIRIYRVTPAGDEAVLAVFTRGEMFAEAAVLTGADYPASAAAATGSRVVRIPGRPLLELVHARPELSLQMLASLSRKLHLLTGEIERLKAQSGAQRVAAFLLSLCDRDRADAQMIDLPFEKTLIAGKVGMKPESLSRAFARLRNLGVRVSGDRAEVADVSALRRFVAEGD